MNKTKINAEIVAHSLSPQGDELISVLCTFPRIILAEVNTHRMLSKNTSSSRAIPFNKMVEAVQNNPFIPIAYQKHHSGMQGLEYHENRQSLDYHWLQAKDYAVNQAKNFHDSCEGTKQLANRLLEPFMWTTMLITGSREGWDNFFELRCPVYQPVANTTETFKSKRDAEKRFGDLTGVDWFKINKGQAEIHMMALAEAIYDAMNESTPKQLKAGEWHIPMISDLESLKLSIDEQIKLSVGRAANTSYTVIGDGKELTLDHAIKIHDKCVELVHSSVFEHCARAMSDEEHNRFYKGIFIDMSDTELENSYVPISVNGFGWCNNLKGFIPYRYFIDNKIEL